MISVFFFNDTATTEIYTRSLVGSVRCVEETGAKRRGAQHRSGGNADDRRLPHARHPEPGDGGKPVSYTHLRAHETVLDLVCRLLLEKKKMYRVMTLTSTRFIYARLLNTLTPAL